MNKNIFKIDNYFIPFGAILLVISLIGAGVYLSDVALYKQALKGNLTLNGRKISPEDTETLKSLKPGFPLFRTTFMTAAVSMLIIGFYYRRLENKIIPIWNALEIARETKVDDLSASLGIPRRFIINNLSRINLQNGAYYVYDSKNDKIVDGKLKVEFQITEKCPGCGNTVQNKVTLDLSEKIICNYCGTAIASDTLNKHKMEILRNTTTGGSSSGFSWGVFILLFLFFWPAAIIYAIVKANKSGSSMNVNQDSILEKINNYKNSLNEIK